MQRTVRNLLATKPPGLYTVNAEDPVRTAIQLMADHHVGALPVMRGPALAGIISERDYARKVVLMGRNSAETPVWQIMSAPVVTVGPQHSVGHCMRLMTDRRIRHLPVVQDGALVGMVSIGDCVHALLEEQREEIDELKRYIAS
ncbi:MAG: CBS domain-containing protein [Steroidobacteraceae bacterium]|jgi:CBS domain-containing protein|nr:CBS domain-containing protein [Steroidobacteraceae bacterium]